MVSLSGGIQVADECVSEFVALRMKRAHRFMILKVNDDKTQIVLEHVGARDATFEQFKELMPKDGGRYELYLSPNISKYKHILLIITI
jgi:cofilin